MRQTAIFREQDSRALRSRSTTISFEETMQRADGAPRILRTIKRALPAPDGGAPRYVLGISQDVTEERSVEARLAYMAMHDALTGLPNRAFFADHIQREASDRHRGTPTRAALSRCRPFQAHQ